MPRGSHAQPRRAGRWSSEASRDAAVNQTGLMLLMMNPEQESPSREPWAQLPRMPGQRRETGVAYEAFQGYYRLPPDERSARLTALKLGKFKTVCFDFAALRSRTFIVQRLPVSDRCSFDEIARLRFKSLLRLYDSFSGR